MAFPLSQPLDKLSPIIQMIDQTVFLKRLRREARGQLRAKMTIRVVKSAFNNFLREKRLWLINRLIWLQTFMT